MKKLLCALAFVLAATQAHAQATVEQCIRATPTGPCEAVNAGNPFPVSGGGGGGTYPITSAPRNPKTKAPCTVGTSSSVCLPANTANTWIQFQNISDTATIFCNWGAVAVMNDASSFKLGPGQSGSEGPMTAGVDPQALNCIASAADTPLYVEYR